MIDGEKTNQTARPKNGSVACVMDEEGGFVTLTFFNEDGTQNGQPVTFMLENARLTSVVLVPDAVYQGIPAIEFPTSASYFNVVKPAGAQPSINDNGENFDNKQWFWRMNATGAEATAFLRLNPSSFAPEYIKDVTLRIKSAKNLRSVNVTDENGAEPVIIAPKDGKWANNVDKGVLSVGLKDYIAGKKSITPGQHADNIDLIQFDVTTTKNEVALSSDWAVLYMTEGGLKQPYLFLEEAEPATATSQPALLARKFDDVKRENRRAARSLNIALRTDTDLKEALSVYTNKLAPAVTNKLDVEQHELRYEFYQMPIQAGGKEYYKVTKEGIVTPQDLKGNAYKPVAEGKQGVVQVRLFMKDKLVALAYLKIFITKVDPIEPDDYYNYWEESYDGKGKAGNNYKPVFTSKFISGAADAFTTVQEWPLVNYLKKWELTLKEFHDSLHYEFQGIASKQVAPMPKGVTAEQYLAGTTDITVTYDDTKGTFTLTRTPDSKCMKPGTYYLPVYFKQVDQAVAATSSSIKDAYPKNIVVYFKIVIEDPSVAAVDEVIKTVNDYKVDAFWKNSGNTVEAKGMPSTPQDGYVPTLKSDKVFNTIGKFQDAILKAAEAVYGTNLKFTAKVVSVKGGAADKNLYQVTENGKEFAVTRTGVLATKEIVTVSYGFASTECPEATRELFTFDIEFDHAATYEIDGEKISDKEFIRVKDGVIEFRDNLAEHTFAMKEVLKMYSNEASRVLLLENGFQTAEGARKGIIGGNTKFKVAVTLPADNDFVQLGLLVAGTPSGFGGLNQTISWKNLASAGHGKIQETVTVKATLVIQYGTSYEYEEPLLIRIIPDHLW